MGTYNPEHDGVEEQKEYDPHPAAYPMPGADTDGEDGVYTSYEPKQPTDKEMNPL